MEVISDGKEYSRCDQGSGSGTGGRRHVRTRQLGDDEGQPEEQTEGVEGNHRRRGDPRRNAGDVPLKKESVCRTVVQGAGSPAVCGEGVEKNSEKRLKFRRGDGILYRKWKNT